MEIFISLSYIRVRNNDTDIDKSLQSRSQRFSARSIS